jgi:hypothetical protein
MLRGGLRMAFRPKAKTGQSYWKCDYDNDFRMVEYVIRAIRTETLYGGYYKRKYASLTEKNKFTWKRGWWVTRVPKKYRVTMDLDGDGRVECRKIFSAEVDKTSGDGC